tara:strand:- start:232 stop:426 length:195 start_codon:yes stop_codon:yes gene_type:complete
MRNILIDYKIIYDNLINNTTLDEFMVKPESTRKFFPKNERQNMTVDDDGVYLVGFAGQFRTSRR